MANHAFSADLQAVSFFVSRASPNGSRNHLVAVFVAQINACIDAAEGADNVVDNAVDKNFKV